MVKSSTKRTISGVVCSLCTCLVIACGALLIYYGVKKVNPFEESKNWMFQAKQAIIIETKYTGDWFLCECDGIGGANCKSRYPCLQMKMRSLDDSVEAFFYLTHSDVKKNSMCFNNPEEDCFPQEDANKQISDIFLKMYTDNMTVPISSFYINTKNSSQAVQVLDAISRKQMLRTMVPVGFFFCLFALFVFVAACIWICNKCC